MRCEWCWQGGIRILLVNDKTEWIGGEDVLGNANREEVEGTDYVMRWFGYPCVLSMGGERFSGKGLIIGRMVEMLFVTEVVDGD